LKEKRDITTDTTIANKKQHAFTYFTANTIFTGTRGTICTSLATYYIHIYGFILLLGNQLAWHKGQSQAYESLEV